LDNFNEKFIQDSIQMKVKINRDVFFGFVFGFFLLIAQINLTIGSVIMLCLTFLMYREYFFIDSNLFDLIAVLFLKVSLIFLMWVIFKSGSIFVLAQVLVADIILISLFFLRINKQFLIGFMQPLILLLLIDFLFNLSIYIFGVDFFGRGGALRPGDIIPRVGGVFGHPFYSVNIALVGLFGGLILKNKPITVIAISNFLMNGTFRSALTLILFICIFYAIKFKFKLRTIIIGSILFAGIVFASTIYSAGGETYGGNTLRVFAWVNAIEHISQNPILGTHTFSTAPLEDMSEDIIAEHGIAESAYLQYALDYGIPVMLLHLYIIYRLMQMNYKKYKMSHDTDQFYKYTLILGCMIFADTFYGTLFGSVLTAYVTGILMLSYTEKFSRKKGIHE